MTRFLIVLVAGVALGAPAALAHAMLQRASPAVGSTIQAAPRSVTISFSEAVEPLFSSITVQDADGKRVDAGKVRVAPSDAKQLIVDLQTLHAGVYTVIWHATSVDTHKTEGRFEFTVAP